MSVREFYENHERALTTAFFGAGAIITLSATALLGIRASEYDQNADETTGQAIAYKDMGYTDHAQNLEIQAAESLDTRNTALLMAGAFALATVINVGIARREFSGSIDPANLPGNYSIYNSETYLNQQDC